MLTLIPIGMALYGMQVLFAGSVVVHTILLYVQVMIHLLPIAMYALFIKLYSREKTAMNLRETYDIGLAEYIKAIADGDAEAVARFYTENAILISPGYPPIVGQQAILEHKKEVIGSGSTCTLNVKDFQQEGDNVYVVGTIEAPDYSGNYLEILKVQKDGSLLIYRMCVSSN